ncbi:hypothetical protein AB0K60_06860 [Thermopolyspora sp. NPDC052614]|uniref:hypothetical protein n=1 Tax=Thermopolyspora sp. NPDC052614 TaxID=3155682 RepID=UPI00341BC342
MNSREEFSASQALGEIGRIGGKVRRSARRGPRYFLAFGVAAAAYWAIIHFADRSLTIVADVGWLVFCVVSIVYACRSHVYHPVIWRLQWVVTGLFLAATVFNLWVMRYVQEGVGAGPVLAGVAGVLASAAPPLYGAWRGMAALGSRTRPVAER